jgi:hypothetical protein
MSFREASRLPAEQRHEFLLERLEDVYNDARGANYTNKDGEVISKPDGATASKVLAHLAVLFSASPELEQKALEAKARLVAALEALPGLAVEADVIEQRKAILGALRDAATIAALKPNADINATVGVFRVVAQALGIGKEDEDVPEGELREMAQNLLKAK